MALNETSFEQFTKIKKRTRILKDLYTFKKINNLFQIFNLIKNYYFLVFLAKYLKIIFSKSLCIDKFIFAFCLKPTTKT